MPTQRASSPNVGVVLGAWIEPAVRNARPLLALDPAQRWAVLVAFSLANETPHPDKGILRGGAAALTAAAHVDADTAQQALDWMVDVIGWAEPADGEDYMIVPVRSRVRAARTGPGRVSAPVRSAPTPEPVPARDTIRQNRPRRSTTGLPLQPLPSPLPTATTTTPTPAPQPTDNRSAAAAAAWDFMAESEEDATLPVLQR
jgi:hypothetical protein